MSKLDQAINALRALPVDDQERHATELLNELSLQTQSGLSAGQREIVAKRLSEPFDFATPESVSALYQKY